VATSGKTTTQALTGLLAALPRTEAARDAAS
jgi:hypothetical protein